MKPEDTNNKTVATWQIAVTTQQGSTETLFFVIIKNFHNLGYLPHFNEVRRHEQQSSKQRVAKNCMTHQATMVKRK
ncbi:hypothetical protein PIB30_026378 [Stylosanthes scabra]|uniref:Uncharacterized protein n=1 Tax=Stylosanthes scabra TaxID=79078 RepID=A0ABU6Q9V3_9FABA|nr:hypothetical protein [Stylosanthes scabra]